ncbi:MAG: hypothetical protein IKZ45_02795 [Fibrobacter sp.]|jgi:8-oxo-dGTP diphosphatase|nr:hypothetical protein [Fibrobacter sp.]
MMVVCGVAEREGKVLVCRRGAGVPYAGAWEFPSAELLEGETLENSVETAFFDRISVVPAETRGVFAFNSSTVPDCRIFTFKVNFLDTIGMLNGYDEARWVRKNLLKRLKMHPDGVTIVKEIQFFS